MPHKTIRTEPRAVRWSVCFSLIVALSPNCGSVIAQEPHPLQTKLEGLWSVVGPGKEWEPETLFELRAESILTAEAESYRRSYRFEEHDDEALCRPRSPAAFAGTPVDFEIFDRKDAIYIIVFEQVRRVYLDGRERPVSFWPNKVGWSDGYWDGNTLVVRTNDFTEGAIPSPEPLVFGGPDAELIERYTLSEDASRLSVQLNLHDPKYYLYPMEFNFDFARSEKTLYGVDCLPSVYVH